jgi:cyclophilin family peptidyl-prolyl cis-trans isomerase
MPRCFRSLPLYCGLGALLFLTAPLVGAQAALASADSALVGRILLAEDARDSLHPALAQGIAHRDARIRHMAVRARARISDPLFAKRDSLQLPAPVAPPVYPETAWRLRYRALTAQRSNCGALLEAMTDSAWPVRLRAMDLLGAPCATDARTVPALQSVIAATPSVVQARAAGGVTWHGGAHALVALARVDTAAAARHITRLAAHPQAEMREYVVRAAALLSDASTLERLATDVNANVQTAAIEALRRLPMNSAREALFVARLEQSAPQVVRAAALALSGSQNPRVRDRADAMYRRWSTFRNASYRDVRVALLAAAGRDTASDLRLPAHVMLPPRAVALALGGDVRVRVTMAPESGGGSFVVRLRGDVAPIMAATVAELAEQRYYDGLTWHRVEHDFVIQGGSPDANEYAGWHHYLRDALGSVPHVRGTVGMSTRGHDTGDAQWFVNVRDNLRLNRDYTVFAEVIEGIDTVDGILEGDRILSMRVIR